MRQNTDTSDVTQVLNDLVGVEGLPRVAVSTQNDVLMLVVVQHVLPSALSYGENVRILTAY